MRFQNGYQVKSGILSYWKNLNWIIFMKRISWPWHAIYLATITNEMSTHTLSVLCGSECGFRVESMMYDEGLENSTQTFYNGCTVFHGELKILKMDKIQHFDRAPPSNGPKSYHIDQANLVGLFCGSKLNFLMREIYWNNTSGLHRLLIWRLTGRSI